MEGIGSLDLRELGNQSGALDEIVKHHVSKVLLPCFKGANWILRDGQSMLKSGIGTPEGLVISTCGQNENVETHRL